MKQKNIEVIPYLEFRGNCEEAINAYIEAFGGEIHYMSRWPEDTADEPPEMIGKVMHGGAFVMQKILKAVLNHGARLAEPGEFTKRAFLNGRIDLSRAEAVMDVIHSQNEYALRSSVNQLKGSLEKEIRKLRADILYEIAFIESALDDPEHISLEGYQDKLKIKLNSLMDNLNKLISTSEDGRLIKEGINTVILGKPNVGKSSLMNFLTGEESAIVTEIAGTTRDVLREAVNICGVHLNIAFSTPIFSTASSVL